MRRENSFQSSATSFRQQKEQHPHEGGVPDRRRFSVWWGAGGARRSLPHEKTLFASFNPILAKLLSLDKVRELYESTREPDGTNIFNRLLKKMNVACLVSDSDLARVPAAGACVVVANHPFGILDGILLGALLLRVRPDVKILTNYILTGVPELDEYCIPLDPFGGRQQSARGTQQSATVTATPTATPTPARGRAAVLANSDVNQRGLRGAKDWLNSGGMLLIFPAGEVAHLHPKRLAKGVTDPEWNTTAFRLARSTGASALPVFIDGRNSAAFQLMGFVHPRLRTARLAKEFLRKRGAKVEVRIGNKLPASGGSLLAKPKGRDAACCVSAMEPGNALQLRSPLQPGGDAACCVSTTNREDQSLASPEAGGRKPAAPVSQAASSEQPAASVGTEFLRWKTYLLANRAAKSRATAPKRAPEDPKTASLPFLPAAKLPLIPLFSAPEALADAVPTVQLEREIALLPSSACLESGEEYGVYCANAREIPHILREIGRLRELSFRAEDEGTGKSVDLDRYDDYYTHLFVWNKPQKEIVGAYRLAPTVDILRKFGVSGLYTNTLFRFKDDFFELLGPAVELGRSFVRPEYQRQYAPLLLLWKAIGRYVALNPAHPVLFGAVSISNSYAPASRTLMYQFFQAQFATHPLAAMVQPRRAFRSARLKHWDISAFNRLVRDPEELSGSISEFEFDGKGIPVLLKQYLKMGGEVLAFNVDGRFSDTLDGLIVVDLRNSDRKSLQKYLGSEGSARFVDYHRALNGPEFVAEPAD
ncbi:MAG: hypothetical protein DMG61_06450 [Acidobacteria bacterium]|nr:MAG: hypothetical protein DMG61_06450 [Acidobacteriota bacterium]